MYKSTIGALTLIFLAYFFTLNANAQSESKSFFGSELKSYPAEGISAYGVKFADKSNEALEIETTYLKAFEFSGLDPSTITGPFRNANFLVRIERDRGNSFTCPEFGFSWKQMERCFETGAKNKRPGAPSSQFSTVNSNVVSIYKISDKYNIILKCLETRNEPPNRSMCSFYYKYDDYVMRVNAPVNILHRPIEVYCAAMQLQAAVWSSSPFKPTGKCKRPS
jgi:hypothetical protein